MFSLFAQGVGWSLAHYAILVIIIAAVVAILMVILRQMGVGVPPFVVNILWIILAAFVGVLAIKFLLSL